ncbi:MAG: cysteine desulfurase [Deltaproteobacteria bacterium]|nr:cysteine desulfurase [Deltaproteobacteria bacterium]
MPRLYFDYNATTPLAPSVRQALQVALERNIKNPSSVHAEGREAKRLLDDCRRKTSGLLGCLPEEVCFLSGATEANNTVISSVWESRSQDRKSQGRSKIVTLLVEHDSIVRSLEQFQKKGATVEVVGVNRYGDLDQEALERAVDERTLLVALMASNNETGIQFPVEKVCHLAHERGALFHTDVACTVGKAPFDFGRCGADFASLSAHKFYGPKGIGALLIRRGTKFSPVLVGGAQEFSRRAGTENLFGILGLSEALDFSLHGLERENERLTSLRRWLKEELLRLYEWVVFHEHPTRQLPGALNVAFPGFSGQTLLANLDLEGVAASHGSACQSGSLEVSRVLLAMGIPEEEALGSIRLSFGRMTTEGEVQELLEIMKRVLRRMKK